MSDGQAKLRVNLSAREFEVEGSEAYVEHVRTLMLELFEWQPERPPEVEMEPAAPPLPAAAAAVASGPTWTGFGEFLHHMPQHATEVDRILAAGYFVQQNAHDKSFATGEANRHLQEHGIRVGNPSQCVRQSLNAKRVFNVARGRFRVSQEGLHHLRTLMGDVIPLSA